MFSKCTFNIIPDTSSNLIKSNFLVCWKVFIFRHKIQRQRVCRFSHKKIVRGSHIQVRFLSKTYWIFLENIFQYITISKNFGIFPTTQLLRLYIHKFTICITYSLTVDCIAHFIKRVAMRILAWLFDWIWVSVKQPKTWGNPNLT